MGPAMQIIRSYPPLDDESSEHVGVDADCLGCMLGPGGGGDQQLSHTGWIRHLAGLGAFQALTLYGMQLQEQDLACVAAALPEQVRNEMGLGQSNWG